MTSAAPNPKYPTTGDGPTVMTEEDSPPTGTASPTPPAAPAPPPEEPPKEDWAVRYKYLLADFDNFRKRSEREKELNRVQVRAQLLRQLLPILEAFERARHAADRLPPRDPMRQGIDLLGKEWEAFLKAERVEPVARIGSPFRPDDQEAVGEAPVTEDHPQGTVVEVVQQGYRFSGGLLRPAKVIVARRAAPAAATPSEAALATTSPREPMDGVG